jgi:hypothetical protein
MEAYPRLMDALNEVRGQWRRHKLLEGGLLALAGIIAVVVLLVAVDNLIQPGTGGRFLMAAILWVGLAVGLLSLVVRRCLEDQRDDYFAALVERKHPELHNRLINALQLGRDHTAGFSPGLIEAIIHDADRASLDMEMSDSVDARPTKRAALWALAALVLFAGYAAAFTPRFTNGLARLLLPFKAIDPYTQTQIPADAVRPGDTKVAEGKTIEISARVRGVIPASAQLHRKTGAGAWQVNSMHADPTKDDTFRFEIKQATESFDYFITASDGQSPTFHIEVVKPPRIDKIAVTYTLPPYTAQPARTVTDSDGELAGLAGTAVSLELKTSKPLQESDHHHEGRRGTRFQQTRRRSDVELLLRPLDARSTPGSGNRGPATARAHDVSTPLAGYGRLRECRSVMAHNRSGSRSSTRGPHRRAQ